MNLEFNKIAAACLAAGLVMMISGKFANLLYKPELHLEKRGFSIEVSSSTPAVNVDGGGPVDPFAGVDLAALLKAGDPAKGQDIAKKCLMCHSFNKGEPNKVGPNLYGVVGNKKGHLGDGFAYSSALLGAGGNWDIKDLFHFIHKPRDFLKGTKMSFAGIANLEDVAHLIVYLNSLSDNPKPLQ